MATVDTDEAAVMAGHGARQLPAVTVESYNLELEDDEGFIGDKASGKAFRTLLDELRAAVGEMAGDPFGDVPSRELKKKQLDRLLVEGDPLAAGVVAGAIEAFSANLAAVTRRFLRQKGWTKVERIVVGGGLSDSRIGELAIGRTTARLLADGVSVQLQPLGHHPDEAGLMGAVQLAPSWVFEGFDAILAIDVGGSNVRCGIVRLNAKKAPDLSRVEVVASELWRHADDRPKRGDVIAWIGEELAELVRRAAKEGLRLAPFVGIGCPGVIEPDGSIDRGAQNLPGNWESQRFNLPTAVKAELPEIEGREVTVILHNDAVVQGLSAVPAMADVEHWAVLTLGTGLGNASFRRRRR